MLLPVRPITIAGGELCEKHRDPLTIGDGWAVKFSIDHAITVLAELYACPGASKVKITLPVMVLATEALDLQQQFDSAMLQIAVLAKRHGVVME